MPHSEFQLLTPERTECRGMCARVRFICTVALKVTLWLFAWWALAQWALRGWFAPYALAMSLARNARITPPLGQGPPLPDTLRAYVWGHSWLLCAVAVWQALSGEFDAWWAAVAASAGVSTAQYVAAILRFPRQVAFRQGLRRPQVARRPIRAWLHPYLYCPSRLKGDVRAEVIEPDPGRPSVYVWHGVMGADEARPIIFFVHGGGWKGGAAHLLCQSPLLHAFAAAGWVVVSPNYRKRIWPQHVDDAEAALRWARGPDFGSRFRADASRGLVLGGTSAGGHIVTTLAARIHGEGHVASAEGIRAMLLFYPALDPGSQFGYTAKSPVSCPCCKLRWGQSLLAWFFEQRVLRGQPDSWPSAEPVMRLRNDAALAQSWPPTMIVHGEQDAIVPIEHSQCFLEQLAAASPREVQREGQRPTDVFLRVPGAPHSLEVAPNPISEAVFDAAFEFVQQFRGAR